MPPRDELMKFILKHTDVNNDNSLINKIRAKRMQEFHLMMEGKRTILDIGGTVGFWERYGKTETEYDITIVNLFEQESPCDNIHCVVEDGTKFIFNSDEFDMVFSNSVLEHVRIEDRYMMAYNMFMVGKHGFIQTPSYWTPFEPHFMIPLFQFFPRHVKAFIIRHFSLGRRGKKGSFKDAMQEVDSVRLLSKRELKRMFPGMKIRTERLFGFPISYIIKW